jgi:hypothetical protein
VRSHPDLSSADYITNIVGFRISAHTALADSGEGR